ncbi:hypothetical protein ACIZ62_07925 [Acetobacterium carbinolicum]|jgi:hypothetical protein|uniref:hypothetical protein n=1 Tax=Acetobacterium TaxID=33951 RepID=UPI0013A6D8A3|nr:MULTISPECIES: hypothetical protein [unclassified Acetobacterium]MDK2941143.1 hypothetical protein [Acetobacterium sp.]MDZ5725909.1 hypothetical protein [Acetobacterium sp. K1/6]
MRSLLENKDIKISFDVPDGYFMALEFKQDIFDCETYNYKRAEEIYEELKTA